MLIAVENTIQALQAVVQSLPVGTNFALLQLMWVMLQGRLLVSRGAIFPALIAGGLSCREARRCWAALRYGAWQSEELIEAWAKYVVTAGQWQEHQHDGYRGVAVDVTAFWRPRLKGWLGKHFHNLAGRALPAVSFGVVVRVGQMGLQRVPLLKSLVRTERKNQPEARLVEHLLRQVGQALAPDEVALFDAGFKLAALQAAEIERAVVRLAANVTARRNYPAPYKGRGRRPTYGPVVRPLVRTYQGRTIAATTPDFTDEFEYEGRRIKVKGWSDLILPGVVPHPDNETFDIYVFEDPWYRDPLVLGATVRLRPLTSFALYQDRWPVEQVPLAAKHMIGAHRQFVFAYQSIQRWPELALIVGSILTYLAAALPPIPTGFWDKQPKATPGRLRRLLARVNFPKDYPFVPQLRKKEAVTDHLPKGVAAYRRTKPVI
ncbi:MAG TPA: hypothetical protein VEC93_17430 [Anaerolineae bacterium]|nr:hypothetical protein [Anaerolineae bacterium]